MQRTTSSTVTGHHEQRDRPERRRDYVQPREGEEAPRGCALLEGGTVRAGLERPIAVVEIKTRLSQLGVELRLGARPQGLVREADRLEGHLDRAGNREREAERVRLPGEQGLEALRSGHGGGRRGGRRRHSRNQ